MKSDINQTIRDLSSWARKVKSEIELEGAFVFGSLIRNNGIQFQEDSDIDMVLLIPSAEIGIWWRADWIRKLQPYVQDLEGTLIKTLRRANAGISITSIVALTKHELLADIHKDGKSDFFSKNSFYDLLENKALSSLPRAGEVKGVATKVAECFAFTQGMRNKFLSISMNGELKLGDFDEDSDPLPKPIMRQAAIVRQLTSPSQKPDVDTDVARGLEFVSHFLYEKEDVNTDFAELYETVSVRRNARGERRPVTAFQQLLLAEMIFNAAGRYESARREKDNEVEDIRGRPHLSEHSTVFFANRFAGAFPGLRATTWFDEKEDISRRLAILLAKPLDFSNSQPIWWWRDGNFQITNFQHIGDGIFLRDETELKISKVAAVYYSSYKHLFVYVEVDPMEPTGLYPHTAKRLETPNEDALHPYYWEEYGIVDKKIKITRPEYDDGAAIIDGEIESIVGRAEIRVRYVTKYNFVIAASDAPLGNMEFDKTLVDYLDGILLGTHTLENLISAVQQFPSRY